MRYHSPPHTSSLSPYELHRDDGVTIRVHPQGTLLGRPSVSDPGAAEAGWDPWQAMIRQVWRGLELLVLERGGAWLNGRLVTRQAPLHPGDVLELGGHRAEVTRATEGAREDWTLSVDGGATFGLQSWPFSVGGGAADPLWLANAPPGALRLHEARSGGLLLEAGAPLTVDGQALDPGDRRPVGAGVTIRLGEHLLVLGRRGDPRAGALTARPSASLPVEAEFTFQPTGGVLRLVYPDRVVELTLPELRARLMALLLQPSGGYSTGEMIPNELLLSGIWPGAPEKDRKDLNLLIFRLRRDLEQAGLDGRVLIVRGRGGLSTALRTADGARIRIL